MMHETDNTERLRADLRELNILHPPEDWERILGVQIVDMDGWRGGEWELSWETPIGRDDFLNRASASTAIWPRGFFKDRGYIVTAASAGTVTWKEYP